MSKEHRIHVLNMYASHASQVHQLSAQQRTLCSFSTSVKQLRQPVSYIIISGSTTSESLPYRRGPVTWLLGQLSTCWLPIPQVQV
jgi:hypothetical protein